MMKTPVTKIICMLLTLAFLLTPVAAMADGEEVPDTDIRIGNQPECYVIVKKGDLDTSGELFLNGISYEAQLNPKGDIVMRNVDMTAAKGAAQAIADYDAHHPGEEYIAAENMKIISGYGLKVIQSDLPDVNTIAKALSKIKYPPNLRSEDAPKLLSSLSAFKELFDADRPEYPKRFGSLDRMILDTSDPAFAAILAEVYLLLYDIRAAIACGTLPQSILSGEQTTFLLTTFRDILEKSGLDPNKIGFWENNKAWVAYAAKESEAKLTAGDKITISDKSGKTIPVAVTRIWPAPPAEYIYEQPPPPPEPPPPPPFLPDPDTEVTEPVEEEEEGPPM